MDITLSGDYGNAAVNVSTGAAAGGFFAGIFGISMLISLAIMVVSIIGMWKLFEKAGREGWKSLIPIYNLWVLFEIVGWEGWKIFLMLIPFYNIYLMIKFYIELAKAYGQEPIFALGLILLNPVFMLILGFGDSKYQLGKAPAAAAAAAESGNQAAQPAAPAAKPEDPWVNGQQPQA